MHPAEERLARAGRPQDPVHGRIGEDFVVAGALQCGLADELGGVENCFLAACQKTTGLQARIYRYYIAALLEWDGGLDRYYIPSNVQISEREASAATAACDVEIIEAELSMPWILPVPAARVLAIWMSRTPSVVVSVCRKKLGMRRAG